MLKKITIKNISSIGECTIDFKKNKYAFLEENVLEDCVNPVAIYGHNGSGKTSLFRAIKGLILLLGYNVNALSPFPVNQFEFNKAGAKNKEAGIGSISL
jgi:AAA15 family ATPase/GTPase